MLEYYCLGTESLWCGNWNHLACRRWKCEVDHPSQSTEVNLGKKQKWCSLWCPWSQVQQDTSGPDNFRILVCLWTIHHRCTCKWSLSSSKSDSRVERGSMIHFIDLIDMKCGNYTRKSYSFFSIRCALKTKVMGKIGVLMLRTLDCEYRSFYICMNVGVISSLLKSGLVGYTANQMLSWSNSGVWLFLQVFVA